jgi:hypothetical protein
MPGFENAYITTVCPELRIRESGRVVGDYILTSKYVSELQKILVKQGAILFGTH